MTTIIQSRTSKNVSPGMTVSLLGNGLLVAGPSQVPAGFRLELNDRPMFVTTPLKTMKGVFSAESENGYGQAELRVSATAGNCLRIEFMDQMKSTTERRLRLAFPEKVSVDRPYPLVAYVSRNARQVAGCRVFMPNELEKIFEDDYGVSFRPQPCKQFTFVCYLAVGKSRKAVEQALESVFE